MQLQRFHIKGEFKNLKDLELNFSDKQGVAVLIGNNGSGKSNILEALSSVFAGLYDKKHNPKFEYELSYTIGSRNVEISFDGASKYAVLYDGKREKLSSTHLPSQIICSYSGEESRLWNTYYWPFYDVYTKALKKGKLPASRMVYINKYYWNVALLTFFLYDFTTRPKLGEFCQDILGVQEITSVTFKFDLKASPKWQNNAVTNLVKQLNPGSFPSVTYTLAELKKVIKYLGLGAGFGERMFFQYIAAAFLPKDSKLISQIDIVINGDLPAEILSEGEKKLLLMQAVLDIVSDEESLILLDEPDSHVHISRKATFQEILASYPALQTVLTTHSPTLTKVFGKEHIFMLTKNADDNVEVVDKEKQEIVHELSGGNWSFQEENIFFSSTNDILLLEGPSDVTFLSKALSVLQARDVKYADLKFEYIACGGADAVARFLEVCEPTSGRTVIGVFDRDDAGIRAIKTIFKPASGEYNLDSFNGYRTYKKRWGALYPIRRDFRGTSKFIVEDYFSNDVLDRYAEEKFKCFSTMVRQDTIKTDLKDKCNTMLDDEFRYFDVFFDMILEIKAKAALAAAAAAAPVTPPRSYHHPFRLSCHPFRPLGSHVRSLGSPGRRGGGLGSGRGSGNGSSGYQHEGIMSFFHKLAPAILP